MKNTIVKKSGKRVLAVIMTLMLLLGMLPVSVLAADIPSTVVTALGDGVNAEDGEITLQEAVKQAAVASESVTFDASLKDKTLTLATPVAVSGKVVIELSGQTFKGSFALQEGAELTVKGKGALEAEGTLFTGSGTVTVELDGSVRAKDITEASAEEEPSGIVLVLKRGEFTGSVALAEGKTFAGYISGSDCEVKDGDSWAALTGEEIPGEFRVRPAGEPLRPDGLSWNGETAKWNAVEGCTYRLTLYKNGAVQDTGAALTAETNSLNLAETFVNAGLGDGAFTFTVVAVKGEKLSLPSAVSPAYNRDKTAPEIAALTAERTGVETAKVTFRAGEAGSYSYAVVAAGEEAPARSAYTDGGAYTANTDVTLSLTGLTAGAKDVYLAVKDAAGNESEPGKIALADYIMHSVTLPTGEGFTTDPTGSKEVQAGNAFSFSVAPAEGYEIKEVKWGGETLTETNGKYTIASVAESGTVEITAAKKQYKITVEAAVEQDEDLDAAGVIFKDSEGNPFDPAQTRINHGEALVFTLELAEGYHTNDGEAPSIGINSVDFDLTDGTYTLESVTHDLLIRVFNVEKKTYTVAKPTGDGFTFTGEDTVKHGEDYTFTVTANEGYENLKVAVNGTEITAVEGVYTASACKKAPEITVTVSKSKLAVTAEGEGFTLDPESAEIEYGGSYTFAVKPAEGWTVGESGLTVTANGTALTETEGKYTAENITAATVIKVEGMVKKTYTVTLPTGDGFTVTADSGSNTVTHGEDFAFTVTVDSTNGYVRSPDFTVKVGDTVLTGENGRYTIPAVTGDQTVSVSGVSLSSFNIQVSTGGYSITAMTGSKNPAPYGSSYKFKLELKPGYMKTADFAVKANGTPLTADSSGVYTVENIRAHTTIEIFGVSNGSYNITFSSDASYKVTAVNSSLPVAYNGSYSFKVEPNPGYVRGNAFSVKQDGLAMSPDANGVYTIYNIQQNHSVSITGVVAASTAVNYSVTLTGGTGYSYTAQNGSASPVAPGGSYSFKVNLAQGYTKGTNFAVKVNGYALSANNNGVYTISNINANQTVTVTGVIKSNTAGGGTTVPAAPAVTTATLPNGAMGTAYSQTLKANGQNITWSHNGTLPNGLTLNTTTGVISGTPTLNGTFRFSVKATNNAGSNTRQLTITITGEEYKISDGQKAQWTQGGEEGVLFRTDSKSQFVKVQVDGKDVAARYVETADNGASVTLKPDYLEDLDNGAHTLTIVYSDGSAKTTFTVAAEDKSEPPTIAVQPESQTADSGDKISFTVMANGTTPLICQWQVDKNDGNGWQNITGAVNASYTVTADTVHNGYKFRCTVTNSAGSATSEEAVLTVNGAEAPAGDEGETPDAPDTVGKKSNKWLWITVAGVAVAGIAAAGVIVYRNRKFYKD